jgi:hypothetical protein
MTWQTIETAPNDGTPFIGIQTFKTSKLVGMAIVKKNPKLPDRTWQCCSSAMIFESHIDGDGIDTALPFLTHWQPLPQPPTTKDEEND